MSRWGPIQNAFKPLVDIVYPPRCPLCGDAMADQTGLCVGCWQELVIPGEPSCASCQRPFYGPMQRDVRSDDASGEAEGDKTLCGVCLAKPPRHSGIVAATLYNDASRQLVLKYKHGRRIAMATMLARAMAARLPQLDGPWLIVPVPLHRSRLWARGFNQSALLARNLAKITGQELCLDGLIRRKRTPPLGGLGRKERERALKQAIVINPRRRRLMADAQILLVDDVLTSGATSNACIKALKEDGINGGTSGASKVMICCFARRLSTTNVLNKS